MSRVLVVAAGGGGDAITASVLGNVLIDVEIAAVMSYSWDRLIIDPTPGPRARADFHGLIDLAPHVTQVVPESTLQLPGRSTLPQLSSHLPQPLLLVDPAAGALGMSATIHAASEHFRCDELVVVDVGGDMLATGSEPTLRSPTADFLALAAAVHTGHPVNLIVAGIGLDGELSHDQMDGRLHQLDATPTGRLTAETYSSVRDLFEWHPSEANGLLYAAASGVTGTVEVRDKGDIITLTPDTTTLYRLDGHRAAETSLARDLLATTSLDQVEHVIREVSGRNELDDERHKAQRLSQTTASTPTLDTLAHIDQHADRARGRDVDYISLRRLAELVTATNQAAFAQLRQLLHEHRPQHYQPHLPLYATSSAARIYVRRDPP